MADRLIVKRERDATSSPGEGSIDEEPHSKRVEHAPPLIDEMEGTDDSDDEDTGVPPYEVTADEFPRHGVYCPRFSEATKIATEPIRMLLREIDGASDKPENIGELRHVLARAMDIHLPTAKKIGIMGESGVGKSSLINALLAYRVHAYDCNVGDSGTFVPHEYSAAPLDQVSPFQAEIHLFRDGIRDHHLISYFSVCYHHYADPESKFDDEEEQDTHHREAESALEVLRALFCDKEDFSSDKAAIAFVRRAKSDSDPRILDRLRRWLKDFLERAGVKECRLVIEADDMGLLSALLQAHARTATANDSVDQVPSLWPLVRLINIRATPDTASLLNSNLTIADLPGTSDINQLRAKSANGYISSCNAVILVAAIDRARSNPWLLENLRKCLRMGKCILVLTKTDLLSGDFDSRALKPATRGRIENHNKLIENHKRERAHLKERSRNTPKKERAELRRKISKHECKLKALDADKKSLNIVARNEYVSSYFEDKYRKQKLEVFCVSNTTYAQHSCGYDKEDAPSLSVENTGIPALRKHLFLFPAKARLEALVQYCRLTVPSTLNICKIWYSDSRARRQDEVGVIVRYPEAEFPRVGAQLRDDLKMKFQSDVLMPMRPAISSWCDQAEDTAKTWAESYKYSSYRAFVKHKGIRKIKAKTGRYTGSTTSVSWNDELLDPVGTTVVPLFQTFDIVVSSFEAESCQKLDSIFEETVDNLKTQNEPLLLLLDPLIKQLQFTTVAARKTIMTGCDKLKKRLRKVSHDAYVNTEDSYLGGRMSELYKNLDELKGPGCHAARVTRMIDTVSIVDGMFSDIYIQVQNHACRGIEELHSFVSKQHQASLASFRKCYDHFFDHNALESEEGKMFRDKIAGWREKSEHYLATQVEPLIQECLQYSETT